MTDQIDQISDDVADNGDEGAGRRRRMFITGAGIAGAAAIVGKSGVAQAATEVVDTEKDNLSTLTTSITNSGTSTDRTNNAFKGVISNAGNNSHAVLGTTIGKGHAIAGVVGTDTADVVDPVAATWGRMYGLAAATEGQSMTATAIVGGPANGVKGIVEKSGNGSHAVLGITHGGGHSVAGDTPEMIDDPASTTTPPAKIPNPNKVAATWGRHSGKLGAGVGGVSAAKNVDVAGPARGVEGIVLNSTNGSHAVYGETHGGGHSVAGDTPEMIDDPASTTTPPAKIPNPNKVAATWGRHKGEGAGIGGVSAKGYGGEFVGGKAHIRLIQVDNANLETGQTAVVGAPTDTAHSLGEMFIDGRGKLYVNGGKGAKFTEVTRQVLFDDPQRAYDSRAGQAPLTGTKGILNGGQTRSIDLTESTDVPKGASAVLINISVAATGGIGFLTGFNGDTPDDKRPLSASITWDGPNQRSTNSLTIRPNAAGAIKVYAGENSCALIIDVAGYIV